MINWKLNPPPPPFNPYPFFLLWKNEEMCLSLSIFWSQLWRGSGSWNFNPSPSPFTMAVKSFVKLILQFLWRSWKILILSGGGGGMYQDRAIFNPPPLLYLIILNKWGTLSKLDYIFTPYTEGGRDILSTPPPWKIIIPNEWISERGGRYFTAVIILPPPLLTKF